MRNVECGVRSEECGGRNCRPMIAIMGIISMKLPWVVWKLLIFARVFVILLGIIVKNEVF